MKNSESVAPLSPMDELKKLKEVFDLGIITEDEFSQKKEKNFLIYRKVIP